MLIVELSGSVKVGTTDVWRFKDVLRRVVFNLQHGLPIPKCISSQHPPPIFGWIVFHESEYSALVAFEYRNIM